MSILGPLFLSLTAASPIYKGKLADIDTKWEVLAQTFDYRTDEERDPLSEKYVPKSRWSSISYYLSDENRNLDCYNDSKPHPLNLELMEHVRKEAHILGIEIDEKLIKHLGLLLNKDALVIFENKIKVDNEKETLHFDHLQAISLGSVRLRPPPAVDSKIGWRTEFRTADIQITDEQNAAFVMLIYILGRLFYESDEINFYIPISKVE